MGIGILGCLYVRADLPPAVNIFSIHNKAISFIFLPSSLPSFVILPSCLLSLSISTFLQHLHTSSLYIFRILISLFFDLFRLLPCSSSSSHYMLIQIIISVKNGTTSSVPSSQARLDVIACFPALLFHFELVDQVSTRKH